jgi:hypothetical protein
MPGLYPIHHNMLCLTLDSIGKRGANLAIDWRETHFGTVLGPGERGRLARAFWGRGLSPLGAGSASGRSGSDNALDRAKRGTAPVPA